MVCAWHVGIAELRQSKSWDDLYTALEALDAKPKRPAAAGQSSVLPGKADPTSPETSVPLE